MSAVCCALLVAVALVVGACSVEREPRPDATPPAVTLGTGAREFAPLAPDAELLVIQGPQGGFHLLGSVRVVGLEPGDRDNLASPDNPTTEFRVLRAGVRIDARVARYTQGLAPVAGTDQHEMVGRFVILDIPDDALLDGVELRFEVEVADTLGAHASDSRMLLARPHPQNP